MSATVTGVVHDAGTVLEARDSSSNRGPSRTPASPTAHAGERIRTVVVDDHTHIARLVASRIATLILERHATGERAVLGLATGSTPIGVYRELIRMHKEEGLSFAEVVTFNLDEYYPMPKESIHSYHRFMWENLFSQVDIDPKNVHIPPGDVSRDVVTFNLDEYYPMAPGSIHSYHRFMWENLFDHVDVDRALVQVELNRPRSARSEDEEG